MSRAVPPPWLGPAIRWRAPDDCRFLWGNHACDLAAGHAGPHLCAGTGSGTCSQYDDSARRSRSMEGTGPEEQHWGEWGPCEEGRWS